MRVSSSCFVALTLCLVVAFARAGTAHDDMSKEQRAESVLRLLTDPEGYRPRSCHRLKRQGEAIYGLWTLGDDASAVLVEALQAEGIGTRFRAAHLLNSFGNESAREPLRKAFLAETDPGTRNVIAGAMAKLFPVAAADMLAESLADSPATTAYDRRIQQLLALGDERALPLVRAFVPAKGALDKPGAFAALCLVEAGDRDPIPGSWSITRPYPRRRQGRATGIAGGL